MLVCQESTNSQLAFSFKTPFCQSRHPFDTFLKSRLPFFNQDLCPVQPRYPSNSQYPLYSPLTHPPQPPYSQVSLWQQGPPNTVLTAKYPLLPPPPPLAAKIPFLQPGIPYYPPPPPPPLCSQDTVLTARYSLLYSPVSPVNALLQPRPPSYGPDPHLTSRP